MSVESDILEALGMDEDGEGVYFAEPPGRISSIDVTPGDMHRARAVQLASDGKTFIRDFGVATPHMLESALDFAYLGLDIWQAELESETLDIEDSDEGFLSQFDYPSFTFLITRFPREHKRFVGFTHYWVYRFSILAPTSAQLAGGWAEFLEAWNSFDTPEEIEKTEDDGVVSTGIHYMTGRGPMRVNRVLEAPSYADIRGNYATNIQPRLDWLMGITGEQLHSAEVVGKIILLHGPAGSGKTSIIRALGRAWKDWCSMEVVTDADAALGNAAYLLHLSGGLHSPPDRLTGVVTTPKYKSVVFEDIDEVLRAGAQGQALSRLLNQADGILGAGVNMLFILSSNTSLDQIHPAISRPGRCLAEIEVPKMTVKEAHAWLEARGKRTTTIKGDATLAELYAVDANKLPDRVATAVSNGAQYL